MRALSRQAPALVLAVVVFGLLVAASGSLTMLNTMVLIGIYALMATSLGMCYGQAGIMSLGQAAFAAIGAYSTAILTTRWELSPLVGLIPALVVPALVAYPVARLIVRLSPLALALATLFLGSTVVIVLNQGGDLTGGYIGIGGIPSLPFTITPLDYALTVWVCVVLAVAVYTNLVHSAAGRALNTLRADTLRSQADGDRGPHRLSVLFSYAAALSGLAGWFYAHYMSYLAPESLSVNVSLTLLLMVLVGGSRHVLGPVLGAGLLTWLNDSMPTELHGLLYGTALILVLVVAPRGVMGTVQWAFGSRRAARRKSGIRAQDEHGETPARKAALR